jgi:hypothetical protein
VVGILFTALVLPSCLFLSSRTSPKPPLPRKRSICHIFVCGSLLTFLDGSDMMWTSSTRSLKTFALICQCSISEDIAQAPYRAWRWGFVIQQMSPSNDILRGARKNRQRANPLIDQNLQFYGSSSKGMSFSAVGLEGAALLDTANPQPPYLARVHCPTIHVAAILQL